MKSQINFPGDFYADSLWDSNCWKWLHDKRKTRKSFRVKRLYFI